MPELSDYDVATGQRFLSGASNLTSQFFAGGRNSNRRAVLQFSALGGFRSNVAGLRIRVRLNSQNLGTFAVSRWQSHGFIIFDMVHADFSTNMLRNSGSNTLDFEPLYIDNRDYCWIGPALVAFRQNS